MISDLNTLFIELATIFFTIAIYFQQSLQLIAIFFISHCKQVLWWCNAPQLSLQLIAITPKTHCVHANTIAINV